MQDNNGQLADSWEQSNSQFHGCDIFREICLFHGNVKSKEGCCYTVSCNSTQYDQQDWYLLAAEITR